MAVAIVMEFKGALKLFLTFRPIPVVMGKKRAKRDVCFW